MNKSGKKKLLILSLVVMVAFAMMPVSSFATEAVSTADQPAAEQQAAQDEAEAKAKEQQAEEEKAKEQQAAEEAAKQKAAAEEQARQEAAKQAGAESENEQSSGAAKDPSKENDNAAAGADDTADYWNYENKETKTVDNSVSIPDGSYVPDSFSSSRLKEESSHIKITCDKVEVKGGKAFATVTFSSSTWTDLKANGVSEDNAYKKTDSAAGTSSFTIPVSIGADNKIVGYTTSMKTWIGYRINVLITENSKKYTGKTNTGGNASKDDPKNDTPSGTKKLKAGKTYKVKAKTDFRMLNLYPAEGTKYAILKVAKDGSMTATITLTGQGYKYVYMGTQSQAEKAGKSAWSKFTEDKKTGLYSYNIKVSATDKWLNICGYSKKYSKWFEAHKIIFYTSGAKEVSADAKIDTGKAGNKNSGATSGKQTKFQNNNKKDKVSHSNDDRSATTHAVNNRTTLKDGVYKPDAFSWSGGSGRMAYIRCNKLTVTGGKVYATIEFGSPNYDSLRANGRVYSKSGGGNSKFVIPVSLNHNNIIVGRTTAMSQPHWIKYRIYIAKAVTKKQAEKLKEQKAEEAKAKKQISKKAPEIAGLKAQKEIKVKYAKYFRIFQYSKGIQVISIDISKDTALRKAYAANAEKAAKQQDKVEYDEDGKPIAKSQHEITEALYKNSVVNYLLVPKGTEVPAGLDKEYVIVQTPAKNSFVGSYGVLSFLEDLDALSQVKTLGFINDSKLTSKKVLGALKDDKLMTVGNYKDPNYAKVVMAKTKFAVLPASALPKKITAKKGVLNSDEYDKQVKEARELKKLLETSEMRFTALDIPVVIDRSSNEKDELAQKEWIKVYGALYGKSAEAEKIFSAQEAKINKQKKADKESSEDSR